eukprot:gene2048-1554_t
MSLSSLLVVFDFDHTMIDCNSDTHIFSKIPTLKSEMKKLRKEGVQWTNLVSIILKKASLEHSMNIQELKELISDIPLDENMVSLIQILKKRYNTIIKIVSDANVLFIKWILEKNEIEDYIDEIISNPCEIVEFEKFQYLNVKHYDMSHKCEICPLNMCKGKIIESFKPEGKENLYDFDSIIYVGDGGNDFCPCTKLRKEDFVFPRKNHKLIEKIENELKSENSLIQSNIHAWENYNDLLETSIRVLEKLK